MSIRKICAFVLFFLVDTSQANQELITNKKSDIIEQSDDSTNYYTIALNDL